ncbi:MAG: hypothetical protein WD097_01945 [Balneolales bacterium]
MHQKVSNMTAGLRLMVTLLWQGRGKRDETSGVMIANDKRAGKVKTGTI